jgi:probable HAF family extracellular repeat protein
MTNYYFTILDDPLAIPGTTSAVGINDLGQIVGSFQDAIGTHGFLYSRGTYTTLDAPTAPPGTTSAAAINNLGQIVGQAHIPGAGGGFLYSGGTFTPLAAPATGINDLGQIVGSRDSLGFLYSGGTYTTLDDPFAIHDKFQVTTTGTFAYGINNSGQIVGYYTNGAGFAPTFHGFLYSGGAYTTFDDPLASKGIGFVLFGTEAYGISNSGLIVGGYTPDNTQIQVKGGSFLLSGGTYAVLDEPSAFATTAVTGINSLGQFVGTFHDSNGTHSFVAMPTQDSDNAQFADFDGNGRSDLLWRSDKGQIVVWNTGASGVWASAVTLGSVSSDWRIDGTGDFNHDGRGDILFRNQERLVVWQTNGQQILSINALGSASVAWHTAGLGDFNGDGTSDILFRNDNGQFVSWQISNNKIQAIQVLGSTDFSSHMVAINDFDGDGTGDLLFRNDAGQIVIWTISNNAIKNIQVVGAASPNAGLGNDWHLLGSGDFNGDSKTDLLWRNDNGSVVEWMLNGTQIQSIQTVGSAGSQYVIDGTGDVNGDGKSDIIFRDAAGNVVEWLMNGASIQSIQTMGSASTDYAVTAHHFDLV